MEKRTKTTKIEKKWKDKNTGELRSIKIDYAKVADRLKMFWEENPRGKIETTPIINEQKQVMFKAYIIADQKDEFSKKATGHTLGTSAGEKDFEKLESLSVGRALALIGYAGDGEIASSEEMEEFEKFKEEKLQETLETSQEKLMATKTISELQDVWASLPVEAKLKMETLKNSLKTQFAGGKNENN